MCSNVVSYTLDHVRNLPFDYNSNCAVFRHARRLFGYLLQALEDADQTATSNRDHVDASRREFDCASKNVSE